MLLAIWPPVPVPAFDHQELALPIHIGLPRRRKFRAGVKNVPVRFDENPAGHLV